jgi:uncharacterized protein (TIGR02996 family)
MFHSGTVTSEDQLLTAIFAEPQIDEHRRVYADWLCTRGDPRGEFIALQLAEHDGLATKLTRERARELTRMHAKTWLGPLDHVLDRKSVVFERGFPIRANCKPGVRKPEQFFGEPSWATFEHLSDPPLALLQQPNLGSLHSLSLHRDQVRQLLQRPPPVPTLDALEVRATKGQGSVPFFDEQDLYTRSTWLPTLASLRFVHYQLGIPAAWHFVLTMAKLRRFAVLRDNHPRVSPAGHWAQWLRGSSLQLEQVTLGDPQLEVTLSHVDAGDWARAELRLLTVEASDERVRLDLENLRARGVTQITIAPNG